LIVWAWLQEDEIKSLRAGLEVQKQERSALDAQIVTMQSTATALEERLAVLEAGDQHLGSAVLDPSTGSGDPLQEIGDLQAALAEIQMDVGDIRSVLSDVVNRMDSFDSLPPTAEEPAQTIPPTARLSVARQQQSHNLSCESSAASMVAQYHGVQLSEEEVIASLPASSNPHLGFRGNVDGPTGSIVDYGVYVEPISDILNARGLQARTVAGGIEGIKAAIARGNPVIAWVTYNCEPSTPTTTVIDDQEVTLVPNQHVVVVTGFNTDGIWANDPWDGQEDFYQMGDFERAMSYFGNMAVEIAHP
jgi:uncharacterized protein YvpB